MDLRTIKAIDVHAHFDFNAVAENDCEKTCKSYEYMNKMFKSLNIQTAFLSSYLCSDTNMIISENKKMLDFVSTHACYKMWAVADPRNKESLSQISDITQSNNVVGIKFVPAFHEYNLLDYEKQIFKTADDTKSILAIQNEGDVSYMSDVANRHPDTTIIMAGLHGEDYITAIEQCTYGNLYTDTGSAAMINDYLFELAEKRGISDKILYGSAGFGFIRSRIEYSITNTSSKEKALRENAEKIFSDKIFKGSDL